MRCPIVPEDGDLKRIPGCNAVNLLAGGGDGETEDTAKSDEYTEPNRLSPENLFGILGIAGEVRHV